MSSKSKPGDGCGHGLGKKGGSGYLEPLITASDEEFEAFTAQKPAGGMTARIMRSLTTLRRSLRA